jgi:surface carbohydrate biosynthesis protein
MSRTNGQHGRIAFIVDHPQRDLAGIVLTAVEVCQRGATCHLVPLNLQHREVWSLAPDLVVLNYLRRSNERFGRQLVEAGIGVAALDTEGGVWPDVGAYTELLWQDADLRRQVGLACMWGPHLAEALVAQGILATRQIAVTGCPRFDLYHPLWHGATGATPDRRRPSLLINTNFSVSNPRFATAEQNARHLQEQLGWSQERWKEYVDAEGAAIERIIALAQELHRDYSKVQIVLRPHPFENLERYRLRLRDASRIRVENNTPIQREISRASAVIQRSCSTGIEAGMAGVPTFSPQWVPAPWVVPSAESVSDPCASYEELREKLDLVLAGGYQSPPGARSALDEVVRDWFHRNDGLAFERVGGAVAHLLGRVGRVDERRCLRHLCGLDESVPVGLPRLAGEVRFALGLSPDWSFRSLRHRPETEWPQSAKSFAVDEVRELVRHISEGRAASGRSARPVEVRSAREDGDYLRPHQGHSITLRCS